MEFLSLFSYTDVNYSQEHKAKLTLPLNPESLKFEKGIVYQEDKALGTTNGNNVFEKYKPEILAFAFIVDCTGVVEGTRKEDRVYDKIKALEDSVYSYNSEGHRPSYVIIVYGTLVFKGQLDSMKVEYTLFNTSGIPLRAKVELSFSGFRSSGEDKKMFTKLSPDMSRIIVMKESDTLACLCYRIYGDSLFAGEVARFNNLNGFRDIPAGTSILFPPLKKE
ncbi:LysM peptidoglycan-binding domain-containing protein [Akkermansia glycaniphila]|uniref:Contractile injection system tube protein N-terminal domain-containing protein n=1 Tax=Akkermansia glycaniphila TaxID=1679444 RepID=A0A1C7PBV8_9BACT|nr:hypothetical protein [Akkermansia glycaniphila]OCA03063.1 hypothetical protein AC781_06755 [Akkermansia glycaniphila]SEH86402.1 Hypothetical protein PYTT_1294 [Akkermansia glycaniphila]